MDGDFWRALSDADREAAYSPRRKVPDAEAIVQSWRDRSAAIAARGGTQEVSYGDSERQTLHLFPAQDADAPTCFFIHGGYWQSFEPQAFYFLAEEMNQAGFSAILPGYDLCPGVRLADICAQVERAFDAAYARVARPMLISGHSAGGHLTGWLMTRPACRDRVAAALPVSGVYEPEPLIGTWINDKVGMDRAEAERCSAMRAPVSVVCPTRSLVGADESEQFHEQARRWTDKLTDAGTDADWISISGCNHFNILEHVPDHLRGVFGRVGRSG